MVKKVFDIGEVVGTKAVWEAMEEYESFKTFVSGCLSRYILYDWGDTCKEDWESNDEAVKNGDRVIAVYYLPEGIENELDDQLWIITEADRSTTTLLFPADY